MIISTVTAMHASHHDWLLPQTVTRAPAALHTPSEVSHLAHFFAGRLADFPCLHPALRGCLALAQQCTEAAGQPPPARCAPEDAASLTRALLEVNVRSLVVADRLLCLQLLSALTQVGAHSPRCSALTPLHARDA